MECKGVSSESFDQKDLHFSLYFLMGEKSKTCIKMLRPLIRDAERKHGLIWKEIKNIDLDLESVLKHPTQRWLSILLNQSELVGFASGIVWGEVYVAQVGILPKMRGRGLCNKLMDFTFKHLKPIMKEKNLPLALQNTGGKASYKCYLHAGKSNDLDFTCEDEDASEDECEDMSFTIRS